jgi:hypothetical protein
LLVGSVPLETAAEVIETFGRTLGDHLNYLPDGEVGDRILSVPMLAYRVFHGHPTSTLWRGRQISAASRRGNLAT